MKHSKTKISLIAGLALLGVIGMSSLSHATQGALYHPTVYVESPPGFFFAGTVIAGAATFSLDVNGSRGFFVRSTQEFYIIGNLTPSGGGVPGPSFMFPKMLATADRTAFYFRVYPDNECVFVSKKQG